MLAMAMMLKLMLVPVVPSCCQLHRPSLDLLVLEPILMADWRGRPNLLMVLHLVPPSHCPVTVPTSSDFALVLPD